MSHNIYREVLNLLDGGSKWTKGRLYALNETDQRVAFCMLGALEETYRGERITFSVEEPGWQHCLDLLLKIIRSNYPQFTKIYGFNDAWETTFDDVRTVLEKAALLEDEKI